MGKRSDFFGKWDGKKFPDSALILCAWMDRRGIETVKEAAEFIGVKRSVIYQMFRGEVFLGMKRLRQFATAFGVSPVDFVDIPTDGIPGPERWVRSYTPLAEKPAGINGILEILGDGYLDDNARRKLCGNG